jgi:hypothetical protein
MVLQKFSKLALFTAAIFFSHSIAFSQSENLAVDHRYSVPWWQSLLCLPDDPVKTLVGREGEIFGDYGYKKGPRDFSFSVMFDSKTPSVWKSQHLGSASNPMTHTIKESDGITITEDAFLEIPAPEKLNSIVRFDSRLAQRNWSKPKIKCDAAFNDIAEGQKGLSGEGLIEFHIKVTPGSSHKIALGFCEGKWEEAGQRVMRVHVEGADQKDIDPVKDFGAKTPGVYFFDSKDADQDGELIVVVTNMPGAKDRNAIVNGLWMFNDQAPSATEIISGSQNKNAVLYVQCANVGMPERRYHLLINLKNNTSVNKVFSPVIKYAGIDKLQKSANYIQLDEYTRLSSSLAEQAPALDSADHYTIALTPVNLKAGEQKQAVVTISRFFNSNSSYQPSATISAEQKQIAENWWQKNCPSAKAISVPDSGIQDMVVSSLRNIFQSRDIREGNKAFHVGPTIYRGLWLADGSFLLEVGTMLNYVKDVRSCIDYLTRLQLKDGGFEMITTFHKENGLVPFMLVRHAMLTQDKKWMNENWSVIEGCIKRINYLRGLAMKDSTKPYYGLIPNGNVDGGIQDGNDYSNTEWCLSGMKWAISAATWLGKNDQAATWQKDYDQFFLNFMNKARKDIRKDEKGNTYLPVMINNEGNYAAQRGQWAFCQSVYPGKIYDDNTEAHQWAAETVDMLTDHRAEGLVINTGWMKDGIWSYFTSFYAHALLWLGKTQGIPQLLYDFANHSSPTMVWREEQKPVGKGNDEVGDMPHNWASAEFIRMTVHMIEFDRGKELHLFQAIPKQWAKAGAKTQLNGIRTPFGLINLSLEVNAQGTSAKLNLAFDDVNNLPEKIVLHKESWTAKGGSEEIKTTQQISMDIPLQ